MGLFGKKKETGVSAGTPGKEGRILVLGGGCAKCHQLEENVQGALADLGREEPVTLITDFGRIAAYGVMSTPALVVDGQVLASGRVLTRKEVAQLLEGKV